MFWNLVLLLTTYVMYCIAANCVFIPGPQTGLGDARGIKLNKGKMVLELLMLLMLRNGQNHMCHIFIRQ